MDIQTLTTFFMWCTILNVALLIFSYLVCAFFGDFSYRINNRFFPISREAFSIVTYSFLGLYKILILVFNVIPYIALLIVG